MAPPRIIPALADLTQDIAGPVPVELLYSWAAGDQNDARAESLLAPYRIEGIVVSSDASGLSRMTNERDLLDVLALISEPKQIVHGIAVEIGGRPIGTWVADNTQTFYPPAVEAATVVDAMWEAEHRIACDVPVAVGMCAHRGRFVELGGGLYGLDAHIVESIAEHDAGPGELLVTEEVRNACPSEYVFREREHLKQPGAGSVYSLSRAAGMRHLDAKRAPYPHAYPREFFTLLDVFKRADDKDAVRRQVYATYLRQAVVVFLVRARTAGVSWDGAGLLEDLIANVVMDALVRGLDGIDGHIAALGGGHAILTFDSAADAMDAAQGLRRRFGANSVAVKIGIASGPVLLFSNPRGRSGIAGSPINVASKISEDAGVAGRINLAADVASQLPGVQGEPFDVSIGGVTLRGMAV